MENLCSDSADARMTGLDVIRERTGDPAHPDSVGPAGGVPRKLRRQIQFPLMEPTP
jgi:hypothetical protein